ncbi:hypothetical protein F511_46009 [Dorcoceras hygrometricum]|uniref:Uncharacterized protein n=1 Tax=Dorcoceras hygrometricum TaxID=472368 RepID=A0A2Z6ZUL0_9LAMI|nr:hypothetical protein F511_46009 [Dorcoceras hygrometricum]
MAAAGRPPLRRYSASLRRCSASLRWCHYGWSEFFYGLVRACPVQPVKFSGRYAMSGPVLIDFEILSFWA